MNCIQEYNLKQCNCTFSCSKKGKCCACVQYHRSLGEFPACFFSASAEKTADRSFAALVKDKSR